MGHDRQKFMSIGIVSKDRGSFRLKRISKDVVHRSQHRGTTETACRLFQLPVDRGKIDLPEGVERFDLPIGSLWI